MGQELAAAAEAHEAAQAPPASTRQPRDELRTLDSALGGLEEEEQPPESGEVESVRKPTTVGEGAFPIEDVPAVQVRVVAEAAPPAALGAVAPIVVDVTADIVSRRPLEGDAAAFLGAVRGERPASFGDLLEGALSLGS